MEYLRDTVVLYASEYGIWTYFAIVIISIGISFIVFSLILRWHNWGKPLFRALSILIATTSVVIFAFEKQKDEYEIEFNRSLQNITSKVSVLAGFSSDLKKEYCGILPIEEIEKARNTKALRNSAADERIICGILFEIDGEIKALENNGYSDISKITNLKIDEYKAFLTFDIHKNLDDLSDSIQKISETKSKLDINAINLSESEKFSRLLVLFVFVFAIGAGIEIANDTREVMKIIWTSIARSLFLPIRVYQNWRKSNNHSKG